MKRISGAAYTVGFKVAAARPVVAGKAVAKVGQDLCVSDAAPAFESTLHHCAYCY